MHTHADRESLPSRPPKSSIHGPSIGGPPKLPDRPPPIGAPRLPDRNPPSHRPPFSPPSEPEPHLPPRTAQQVQQYMCVHVNGVG